MVLFNSIYLEIDVNPTKYVICLFFLMFYVVHAIYSFCISRFLLCIISYYVANPAIRSITEIAEHLAVRPKVLQALSMAIGIILHEELELKILYLI